MRWHVPLQHRPWPSAVARTDRRREPLPADVGRTAPVPRDLAERVEARAPAVGRHARGVYALAADHDDAPAAVRAGAQRGERIVTEQVGPREPVGRQPRRQRTDVARRIRAREAIDADIGTITATQAARRVCLIDPCNQPLHPGIDADLLVGRRGATDRGQQAAIPVDQGDVGLRVPAVDGQDQRHDNASSRTNSPPRGAHTFDEGRQREAGGRGPRVQEDHRTVAVGQRCVRGFARDASTRRHAPPVEPVHVPAGLAIAEPRQRAEYAGVVGPGPERTAEPRPRILAGRSPDRPFRGAHVRRDALGAQQRHAGVIVGVIAHEMPAVGDRAGETRVRLRPASLHEERRA